MSSFSEPEKSSCSPLAPALNNNANKQVDISSVDEWFVEHVLPLEPALMRLLCKHWRQHDEVDVIRQDIYVRVYEHSLRNGLPKNTDHFLMATTKDLIDEKKRHLHLAPKASMAEREMLEESKADELSKETIAGTTEELLLLQAAINDLPPRSFEVVKLRKIEGCSKRTIAEHLDVPESIVDKHLQHGLLVLAQTLYEQGVSVLRHHPFVRRRMKENDA